MGVDEYYLCTKRVHGFAYFERLVFLSSKAMELILQVGREGAHP
jgi:hypothetical protein